MKTILIKNVVTAKMEPVDVRIENGKFTAVAPNLAVDNADKIIDAFGKMAIVPPFYNAHAHAAMSLLRGYADDLELFTWLSNYIWPTEARLTEEDVYHGTRLAILEMIQSGTVFFSDMYWYPKAVMRAACEMGVRCCIGGLHLSSNDENLRKKVMNDELYEAAGTYPENICIACAPHAIYSVAADQFKKINQVAKERDLFIHIHVAETQKEVDDCVKEHGQTPVEYLDSFGLLTPKTTLAHAVYLSDDDFKLVRDRGSVLVNMPVSNMKLASGAFRYNQAINTGCRIAFGTDGASSNNNLSMLEEIKFAAMLAKLTSKNPELLSADDAFTFATKGGADAFCLNAGEIAPGKDADCMLIDLNATPMIPCHHLISNLVYAADPTCIDTVICRGRILMRNKHVENEDEIRKNAAEAAFRLCKNQ